MSTSGIMPYSPALFHHFIDIFALLYSSSVNMSSFVCKFSKTVGISSFSSVTSGEFQRSFLKYSYHRTTLSSALLPFNCDDWVTFLTDISLINSNFLDISYTDCCCCVHTFTIHC